MAESDLPKAIRKHLLADATIASLVGQRIHYKGIPEKSAFPHIFFYKRGRTTDDTLDGDGIVYNRFAVEIVGEQTVADPDGKGEAVADAVFARLHNSSGPFDTLEIDSAFVEDADDNYVFKSVDSDDRLFLKAYDLLVITEG